LPSVVVVTEAEGDFMVAEEGSTAAEEADFMEVAEEGSTAVEEADFMEVAEEGFTAVEVSTAEATLVSAADTPSAGIVAAASTVVAAATAGAADIGAIEDTVMDGDGDLASGGRIGDGDIRMAMATARGITRPTLIILTRTTILQTIRRVIRIRTTVTTILHWRIPTRGPSPTRTDPQDPGDPRHREAQPTRTTQRATSRPLRRVGQFSPLTG
jgi:hypothetical protein